MWAARDAATAAAALQSFALLLAVVAGFCSAIWWHQSAELGADPAAVPLNAAAATATGLAAIASAVASVAFPSPSWMLGAGGFLALLALSAHELAAAALASYRDHLGLREWLGVAVAVAGLVLLVWEHLLH